MEHIILSKSELIISRLSNIRMGTAVLQELKTEIIRKSIHFLIALSPTMALVNRPATMLVLMIGALCYTYLETLRFSGVDIPLISSITTMASRPRDKGRFVLGPVTLGIGALLALLLYPSPAASIAIYALAFGDGFASLIGKLFGRIRPAFLWGKSVEGSLACFTAVLFISYQVSYNYKTALIAAVTATLVEALPLKDYDNLAIPIIVGFVVGFTL
ncbi:MAG: phosphatidate cytidylyltransferase [Treponema sp.]|jgi:dolichol kinase|nr:phosphatidate cytidylyltransferase [Treponema sp.]